MKLSEKLKHCHESGDFGEALTGYAEQAKRLEDTIEFLLEQIESCDGTAQINIDSAKKLINKNQEL